MHGGKSLSYVDDDVLFIFIKLVSRNSFYIYFHDASLKKSSSSD